MRSARFAAFLVGAVFVASCGSSGSEDSSPGDNPPNPPDATFATVPDDVEAPPSPPVDTDATDTGSSPTTTLPIVTSGNADLPTASPEVLANGPTTTVLTGPLPTPSVELVDVAFLETPVELTSRPGDPRNFVVEQVGRLVAFDDLSTEVVLDITDLTSAGGERGFLGVAFSPDADLAYVHYTDSAGTTVLDEYAIDPVTAVFDEASRREVLTVDQPFGNHNGGELAFGPDGYLYLGLGDGGSADDPQRNSLALASRLGKILRIDPEQAGDEAFTVPPDNPFVGVDGADPTIWSLGLRNPWKFSFDELTGDLWIADVGQNNLEEIDFAPAIGGQGAGRGLSFGWSAFEGTERFQQDQDPDGHTPPRLQYEHINGNCSVSGGAVYRGDAVPDLYGWYVYGDFCTGLIWGYDTTSSADAPVVVELAQLGNLVAIAIGGEGDLFAVSNAGTVTRFAPG